VQLAAVAKARALAIIELDELNVGGKIRFLDCVKPLVERYGFAVYPQKPEDFDLSDKGVRFESGKAGEITIDSLVIYSGAILVDTFSSTDDSKRILLETLEWGRDALGLTFTNGMIRRWGYISDIVFYTDFPLLASFSSPLQKLAEKTSRVTEQLFSGLRYESSSIRIGHDPMARKNGIASLIIEHRVNTPFEENKYFSEAPLPTKLHIKFLEEFEADVLAANK
jgi:hypothetical protein